MSKNPTTNDPTLPDWWAREKRQRQTRTLVFLSIVLALIGYYYYISKIGKIGVTGGVVFDTSNYITFIRQEERDRADGKGKETVSNLYAVRADGTDLRLLNAKGDISNKSSPFWTKDGKSVLPLSPQNRRKKVKRNSSSHEKHWILLSPWVMFND